MQNGNKLSGSDVREIFEQVLPDEALQNLIDKSKFQQRVRKCDALAVVRTMVIAAATGYGGRQADVMRLYFQNGAQRVARGGFYAWFGPELEKTLEGVSRRALDFAHAQPLDLPNLLSAHARDWHIVDSQTIKLHEALSGEYPGTGDYAALKVHKRFSVGTGTLWEYHLSPAREHDAPHLVLDETWRDLGLLVDLGYASLQFISDCERYQVRFVMRLKESWKPKVERLTRGEVTRTFFAGTDLDVLLEQETLLLRGRVVDAEVTLGQGKRNVRCRLVGIPAPDHSYRFYLTNLPGRVGPHQIADLYRVRWEVESDNKLDKSCNHLDEVRAQTGPAARALIHASLVSSMLACLIVHRQRLKEGPPPRGNRERKSAPLHPQSLARAMGCAALRIAWTFDLAAEEADKSWQQIAEYLCHMGQDPNWRRSPSVLDQLRGWHITPGRPKSTRLSSAASRGAN